MHEKCTYAINEYISIFKGICDDLVAIKKYVTAPTLLTSKLSYVDLLSYHLKIMVEIHKVRFVANFF